ncbi:hypothetical protein QOZ80_6BG0492370 [Eleusine coracana subsp. coracana]|nr:hypothetical protein QOZ80_6BG0492370 [Eleusine coracana subsp. coracana]
MPSPRRRQHPGSEIGDGGGAAHRRLQRMPRLDDDGAAGPVPRINVPGGPMVPLPAAAVACWKSILASENCVDDILESLVKLELRVSKVCCSVLEKIGDNCIISAFSSFPFNPLFPPLVRQVCSLAA